MKWYYLIPGFGLCIFLPGILDAPVERIEKYDIIYSIYQAIATVALVGIFNPQALK